MKKIISLLLTISLLLALLASCAGDNTPDSENPDGTPTKTASEYKESRDVTGRNIAYVTMTIKNYGTVRLLLDATTAPITVGNFLSLVKRGFYNGTSFYSAQAIQGEYVVMGGDTVGDGTGGSDEAIFCECTYNGHTNDIGHKPGTISMLYRSTPNDATSHFFIASGDLSMIDGYYASFGYVIEGLDIIDKITADAITFTDTSTGLVSKHRQPIIQSITIDQDIDYSLIRNVYIAPPTASDLESVFSSADGYKLTSISYAPTTTKRVYKTTDGYVFQLANTVDGKFTSMIVSVNNDGKLVKSLSLTDSDTAEDFAAFHELIAGLDLEALVGNTEISDSYKNLCRDVLRTIVAMNADDSDASKYIHIRDNEGRETYTVELKIQGYDEPVVILLDATTAPITVANFVSLVEKGFYDGLDFHRIIKGFMIQGGDDSHLPEDEQAANITGEFDSNGHANDIKHIRGTISMARANDPNSASSGFFICDAVASHLDGEYAAFGYVISGMATVDAVAAYAVGKTDSNGNLNANVEQPVIEYIKVITSE